MLIRRSSDSIYDNSISFIEDNVKHGNCFFEFCHDTRIVVFSEEQIHKSPRSYTTDIFLEWSKCWVCLSEALHQVKLFLFWGYNCISICESDNVIGGEIYIGARENICVYLISLKYETSNRSKNIIHFWRNFCSHQLAKLIETGC